MKDWNLSIGTPVISLFCDFFILASPVATSVIRALPCTAVLTNHVKFLFSSKVILVVSMC